MLSGRDVDDFAEWLDDHNESYDMIRQDDFILICTNTNKHIYTIMIVVTI